MARPSKVGGVAPLTQKTKTTGRSTREDKPVAFDRVLTTGSTLLDLAISGTRVRGGGLPGGIFVEVSGRSSTGKTAILAEVCAGAQRRKGEVEINDPEGRFDAEYKRIYQVALRKDGYKRPDTVTEVFASYDKFKPESRGISVFACDSLAALSTDLELGPKGDKMGQRRAKEFSQELRKSTRKIHNNPDVLFICSNQVRDSDHGLKTTGGHAVGFYASIRIVLSKGYPKWRVERTRTLPSGKEVSQQVAIISEAEIIKSSIDIPFRSAPIYIDFGYGVDNVRANLQWLKDMTKSGAYGFNKATNANSMDKAIQKVEDGDFETDLKWVVVDLWEEIQELFTIDRKPKDR